MLDHFPRPPGDTGRGVHWSHSQYFWGKQDWGFWKEQLQTMNIKWVKMLDDGDGSAEGLVKRLIDLEIMPVIRFYKEEPNPGHISAREADTARRYAQMGAVYFETNNEPDLALEWKGRNRPPNWLDIVVNNFIIEADMIREAGGYLLFPAFGPGGRGNPFKMIVEKGRRDILDGNCCLAIHNYCLGRPLDYPNDPITMHGQPLTQAEWRESGGLWAWEMDYQTVNQHRRRLANPDASIMEDSTCFRAFEYFDALVNEAVGHSIPIMTTEGGYNVGQRAGTTAGDDPRYPKPTPEKHADLSMAMFRYIEEEGPDYYFACMPWLIAVSRMGIWGDAFENQGPWFTHHFDKQFGLDGELPLVQRLKDDPGRVRQDGPVPEGMTNFYTGPDLSGRNFDDRFKYLEPQVLLEPVEDPTQLHWKLVEARWADEQEAEGRGYVYVKALDEAGQPIGGVNFQGDRGDVIDEVETKGPVDQYWGNYMMTATLGTYRVGMHQDGLPTDMLINVGLGNEVSPQQPVPTSFFLTFQKTVETEPGDQPDEELPDEETPDDETPDEETPDEETPDDETPGPDPRPEVGEPIPALAERLAGLSPQVMRQPVADPTAAHWQLVGVQWADVQETEGKSYVFVKALDEMEVPIVGATFQVERGEAVDKITTKEAAQQYLGSYRLTHLLGSFHIKMAEAGLPSERVVNLGWGDGQSAKRTSFYLTFQRVPGQEQEPEPDPGQSLVEALIEAARRYTIPVNRRSRLYQYAQANNLGQFLSTEFTVPHQGRNYRAQLFERGIAYFDIATPEPVRHIEWRLE